MWGPPRRLISPSGDPALRLSLRSSLFALGLSAVSVGRYGDLSSASPLVSVDRSGDLSSLRFGISWSPRRPIFGFASGSPSLGSFYLPTRHGAGERHGGLGRGGWGGDPMIGGVSRTNSKEKA